MKLNTMFQEFEARYQTKPRVFKAPGRVNLIGEHTDYNEGYVFPMALDRYTWLAIAPRDDRQVDIYSANYDESFSFSLDDNHHPRRHWSDYVAGMAHVLEASGLVLPGAMIYIHSDVPVGSGLSSSAALEVSSALAFLSLINHTVPGPQLARLAQKAENEFVGMNCGIMDQFISIHGRSDHALFLDCRSLDYKLVPLESNESRIIVCNTMVKHELGASAYNQRRSECEQGVRMMQSHWPEIKALRDVSSTQFMEIEQELPPVIAQRCRHVITEDERVLESIQALNRSELSLFGRLMNASHDSLRDDYQVSCAELDLMVEIARKLPGCLGARMTGGGFGGCTVNLVELAHVDNFCQDIITKYQLKTGLDPQIYVTVPSQGAHEALK
jgi:galactokinase